MTMHLQSADGFQLGLLGAVDASAKVVSQDFAKATNRPAVPLHRRSELNSYGCDKTCSQCGTSRTPQWREGPAGPKTLCNACGVKRVRQIRLLTEGRKRRPPAAKPAAAAPAAAQPGPRGGGGSGGSGGGGGAAEASTPYRKPRSALQRPQRKAAARSASRTAEFASTGDWPDEDAESCERARRSDPKCMSSRSGLDDDDTSSEEHSDSAEEVAWPPAPSAAPGNAGPPSPMVRAVGHETAAAVNLMSMAVGEPALLAAAQRSAAQRAASHAAAGPQAPAQLLAMPQGLKSELAAEDDSPPRFAVAAATATGGSGVGLQAPEQARVQRCAQLALLRDEAEAAAREAAAADAAVAAVAKILAIKQAAAIRARGGAARAQVALEQCAAALQADFAWGPSAKRRRTGLP